MLRPDAPNVDWHKRYLRQASWTAELRHYLLAQAGLTDSHRVLEVGCGTGAILLDVAQLATARDPRGFFLHGLDITADALTQSRLHAPSALLTQGDALSLPFRAGAFDITLSHFLLLWVKDPLRSLREMRRVTRPGGHVLALAEPDYAARVDRPASLRALGMLQQRVLREQGADPAIGARLADLVRESRMTIVETGTIPAWTASALTDEGFDSEWEVLRQDLHAILPRAELDRLMQLDAQARARGERVLHVPMYFVHAQV